MSTSNEINEIAAALAKAQGKCGNAPKDAKNPHFNSKYATLASIWDACRAALSEAGIAVVQFPATDDGGAVTITTRLCHASGQWMESTLSARPAKADAQGIGSVITYLRRYSLAAMVGIAPDDDDDGNAGSNTGMKLTGSPVRPSRQPPLPAATIPPGGNCIPVPAGEKGPDWGSWGKALLTALDGCATTEDAWAIMDANKEPLDYIAKKSPASYAKLQEKIGAVMGSISAVKNAAWAMKRFAEARHVEELRSIMQSLPDAVVDDAITAAYEARREEIANMAP